MNRVPMGSSMGPSTSSSIPTSMPSLNPVPSMPSESRNLGTVTKVAEVFLTAGHAFQRLGDLTLQLQGESVETEESKWAEGDINKLRDALTRFAHELDTISESVQQRTSKHIKVDIKRRSLMPSSEDPIRRQSVNSMNLSNKRPAHVMSIPTGLAAKRIATAVTYKGGYQSPLTNHRLHAPTRPPTTYLTDPSMAGPPTLTPHSTPLLSEPSHHYINTRSSM